MTLLELAVVLVQAEETGRPIELSAIGNPPDSGWRPHSGRLFNLDALTYRVKPEPPKPREWWANIYGERRPECHWTKGAADAAASINRTECIRVREVLDE